MPLEIDQSIIAEDCDDQSSDDQSSVKSADGPGSNRLKFLYGYGGRILPRPGDGKLRYVGGETRVMAADRNITFADLMAKMAEVLGSSLLLKCQLPTEDLDALVSIKSDEDLENMLEEYERLRVKEGSFKVRAFLFPNPSSKSPAATAPRIAARGGGGIRDPDLDEGIVHSSGRVTGSIHYGANRALRVNPCNPSTRGPYPTQHHVDETASMAGRPPRWQAVVPEVQYNRPVRYAKPKMHDRVTMPHQQYSAARGGAAAATTAYVDDGPFVRVDRSSCSRLIYSGDNYHYTLANPSPQVPFPGMATMVPQHHTEYKYIFHNPYYGDGLQGFSAYQQLLVQP